MTDNKSPKYKKKQDSDDFEELGETREIIEDRIFRLKLQMVNLTITQQELSGQMENVSTDKQEASPIN